MERPKISEILAQFVPPQVVEDLRTLARHPRAAATLLESRSAWLGRKFLGAASNLVEPFLVGTGLSVEGLGEDSCEISMPGFLRNQGEGGVIHNAALSALGEFSARIFWEHHLDLRRQELRARSVSLRVLAPARGAMRAIFRYAVGEREAVLHALRSNGQASAESTISVYDGDGRLVAEVDVTWDFSKQLSLGGR